MSSRDLQSLRLAFKRAFSWYFLDLADPALIPDPTEAFGAAAEYLAALERNLGRDEFLRRLDEEVAAIAGEVEQDLRQLRQERLLRLDFDELALRLKECVEYGLQRLDAFFQQDTTGSF